MTKKKFIFPFLMILCIHFPLFAESGPVHNKQLLLILFGHRAITGNERQYTEPLQKALYWCVDQFNGNGRQSLDDLRHFGVRNVPAFEAINFTTGEFRHHQRYTHRGWDWIDYTENYNGQNIKEIWKLRKQLLLSTIDKVFNFKRDEQIKRKSFGALLYYTHILGDHASDSKISYPDRIPISPRLDYQDNRSGENSNNPTVYTELLYHLPRLFREQTTSPDYIGLITYLNDKRNKNRQFPPGKSITDEEYAELQHFAQETLDRLIRYVPGLLKNEPFFIRTFGKV